MSGQIYLNLSACFYTILIAFCFFCKKKVNNDETKIYGVLILISFLELVVGFFSSIILYMNASTFISVFFTKLFFVIILTWIFIFTKYILCIDNKIKSNFKISSFIKLLNIFYIISSLLIFLLPINIKYINGMIFTNGFSLISLFISAFIFMIISISLNSQHLHFLNVGFHLRTISATVSVTADRIVRLHYTGHLCHDIGCPPWWSAQVLIRSIACDMFRRAYFPQRLILSSYYSRLMYGSCHPILHITILKHHKAAVLSTGRKRPQQGSCNNDGWKQTFFHNIAYLFVLCISYLPQCGSVRNILPAKLLKIDLLVTFL